MDSKKLKKAQLIDKIVTDLSAKDLKIIVSSFLMLYMITDKGNSELEIYRSRKKVQQLTKENNLISLLINKKYNSLSEASTTDIDLNLLKSLLHNCCKDLNIQEKDRLKLAAVIASSYILNYDSYDRILFFKRILKEISPVTFPNDLTNYIKDLYFDEDDEDEDITDLNAIEEDDLFMIDELLNTYLSYQFLRESNMYELQNLKSNSDIKYIEIECINANCKRCSKKQLKKILPRQAPILPLTWSCQAYYAPIFKDEFNYN